MAKHKGNKEIIVILSSIIVFFIIMTIIGDNPKEEDNLNDFVINNSTNYLKNNKDNYSDIKDVHFGGMPITYTISVDSLYYYEGEYVKGDDEYEVRRIKQALEIIENSTEGLIRFKEVDYDENPQLIIIGNPPSEESFIGGFMYEGLAGPTKLSGNRISKAQINLYPVAWGGWAGVTDLIEIEGWIWKTTTYEFVPTVSWILSDCENFPNTEVHELLHILGIGHNYENSSSIMFPIKYKIQACKTEKIDEEIINCLKYIYSNGKEGEVCSNLSMYPWEEEEEEEIQDFKWENLPITYNVISCNEQQKDRILKAEKIIEKYVGENIYEFKEIGFGNINFYCSDTVDNILLNKEADFWTSGVYFPAAQPYFYFDYVGKIKEVKIIMFAQNRPCGGIEVHELLHGAGLRDHYSPWMNNEVELCHPSTMIVGDEAINKLQNLYELF